MTQEFPFMGLAYAALSRIDLQLQALLNEALQARHHTLPGSVAPYVDVAIIRVPHETMTSLAESLIELIEHDVAQ
jgi:hypothetical protein